MLIDGRLRRRVICDKPIELHGVLACSNSAICTRFLILAEPLVVGQDGAGEHERLLERARTDGRRVNMLIRGTCGTRRDYPVQTRASRLCRAGLGL